MTWKLENTTYGVRFYPGDDTMETINKAVADLNKLILDAEEEMVLRNSSKLVLLRIKKIVDDELAGRK
jgi:hypothetical protein